MGRAAQNVHHTQVEWGSVHNKRHNQLEWTAQYIMYITQN